jgi:hypothetical protein
VLGAVSALAMVLTVGAVLFALRPLAPAGGARR